jgi:hypothetical protein
VVASEQRFALERAPPLFLGGGYSILLCFDATGDTGSFVGSLDYRRIGPMDGSPYTRPRSRSVSGGATVDEEQGPQESDSCRCRKLSQFYFFYFSGTSRAAVESRRDAGFSAGSPVRNDEEGQGLV